MTAEAPSQDEAPGIWKYAGGAALVVLSTIVGLVVGTLAVGSLPIAALLVPLLLVPLLVWWKPVSGLYLLFAGVVGVEQFRYSVGGLDGAKTAEIPLFHGLPGGANPAELLLALLVLCVVMQSARARAFALRGTPLALLLGAMLLLVAVYFLLGLARGGSLVWSLWEVRPFLYIAIGYFLGSALLVDMKAVRPLLWILVVVATAKAVYGLTIFAQVRYWEPRPEAILAHEESFFFGMYILLVAALWLYRDRGPLRVVATLGLPVVLVCDMVNSRRTAWLILTVGVVTLLLIALFQLPERRRFVGSLVAVLAAGTAVYLPLFWNGNGALAQPARAVQSQIAPNERDKASNQYREIEDFNLQYRIAESRGIGTGFGSPIGYFGLVDLTDDNPLLEYVPHNGVYWHWLRLGIVGMLLMAVIWTQAMISAVRLARSRDKPTAMLAAWIAAVLAGFVAMGVVDMGFYWFRNTLAMGLLLGAVDAMGRTHAGAGLHPRLWGGADPGKGRNRSSLARGVDPA